MHCQRKVRIRRSAMAICIFLVYCPHSWLPQSWVPQSWVMGQYSPEHPKVVGMVDKAIEFLVSSDRPKGTDGGEILTSYAVLLGQADREHPLIKTGLSKAVETIRKAIAGDKESHILYDVAVSVMLLSSYDAERYRRQLEAARDWYMKIQRQNGGFGYISGQFAQSGDTSQTQYVVLALWALKKAGVSVPSDRVEATIRFLLATQDPSGGWGYQGLPSRSGRVRQDGVTRSLATAGISALLMSADILQLFGGYGRDDDGIPAAFERVQEQVVGPVDGTVTIRRDDLEETLDLAFDFQENGPKQGESWYLYWRYAQERYESFREIVDGKRPLSPEWYNEGVEELADTQSDFGAWINGGGFGTQIDTSFAVLFLIRSTQRSISMLSDGLAFGGYELPTDVTSIRMVGDKIVSDAEATVENLLGMMEDEEGRLTEGMLPQNMQLSEDPQTRKAQAARLARLLRSESHTARRLAARLLGRSEEISVAPELIYALLDPDPHVPAIAEEGLRLVSRKLSAVHLRAAPTAEQQQTAVRFWKDWYLGLCPDYVFLER